MASGYYDITNKTLGKGHYGVVKLARHCLTGEPVAIKIIEKSRLNPDSLNQLGTEIRMLFRLSEYEHPNILKLYQTIDTEHKLYLITEYCGPHACDLHDYLSRKQCRDGLSELESQVFFIQICSAISYCHSMGIVHRDLKPENILVTDYKHMQTKNDSKYPLLKLIDFGFANQWHPDEMMRTSCGTLAYSAPELLLGEPYDGTKVDVWGLGLMLYILLYGENPFMQINDNETLRKILDCSFKTPTRDNVDSDAIDLVRSLISRNPDTRLPIDAIFRHKWFSNAPRTMEFMLKYKLRPEQRTATSPTNNLTNCKPLPKSVAQIVSPSTLPSISEIGPLKNITRSVDDNQVLFGGDCAGEQTKPGYNRSRSLSITRSHIVSMQQSNLPQARSSNNLEKLTQSQNTSPKANTSPRPIPLLPHGSPMFRPTSPDVRGSVELTDEEIRLHEQVLREIFRLSTSIDSKSSVEASLKNARFAHRQFNRVDKLSVKLSNDDYIFATYQLTRDKLLRFKQDSEDESDLLETHHDAFSDHHTDMGSNVARFFGSKTDPYDSMAYALPLARKCSLVSEESEPQDNQ